MNAKNVFSLFAILAVAMIVAGCSSQPQAATPALPSATPTEFDVHQRVPTDYVKPGFTPGPTVILTPLPPPPPRTPTQIPDGERAKINGESMPVGICTYCGLVNDVATEKYIVGDFVMPKDGVVVSRVGNQLFVVVYDASNINNSDLKQPVWRALPFVDGKQLVSVVSGRNYAVDSYESSEYLIPTGAGDKFEIQIVTSDGIRFSLWFEFQNKS